MKYDDLIHALKEAYNNAVDERDQKEIDLWKLELQKEFCELLSNEGKQTLLEIGAGTGDASLFFQEQGLKVTCTDLSPENVKRCIRKGLDAHEMDFKNLSAKDFADIVSCFLPKSKTRKIRVFNQNFIPLSVEIYEKNGEIENCKMLMK